MTPLQASPRIADALIRVPRHRFIPRQAWAAPGQGGPGRWIDRDRDPDTWWQTVYADNVLITQLDGGRTELTPETAALPTTVPTCSASSPLLVTAGLRSLAPEPGHRILDIGTGTGWTAGLCTHLTGPGGHVTTVDIDPELTSSAKGSLAACGLDPTIVTADGALGVPDDAPWDRVHVTAGVVDVPYAWVAQTRPGGVIVLPFNPPVGRLLRLVVQHDGTAVGHFADDCSYMPLRPACPGEPEGDSGDEEDTGPPRVRAHTAEPAPLLDPPPGLQILLATLVGDDVWDCGDGLLLDDGASRAVAANGRVTQTGPRDLWDVAERTAAAWTACGRPGPDRIGYAVTPHRQYVWLDDPSASAATTLGIDDKEHPHG